MKFTTTNLTPEAATKIAAENPDTSKGYVTPSQLVSQGTVLSAIKGVAADPSRIGNEFLPEEIPIGSMTFANASGSILADGAFTGGANPNLIYRHNNIDDGGIAYRPEPENIVRINKSIDSSIVNKKPVITAVRGSIASGTYVSATFTASSVNGGVGVVINVPVAVGDTGTEIAQKVSAAFQENATINAKYVCSSFGPFLYARCLDATVDVTLNQGVSNGDTTGVTATSLGMATHHFIDIGYWDLPASYVVAGAKFAINGNLLVNKNYTATGSTIVRIIAEANWNNSLASGILSAGTAINFQNDADNYSQHISFINTLLTLKLLSGSIVYPAWDSASVPAHVRGSDIRIRTTTGLPEIGGSLGALSTAQNLNEMESLTPTRVRLVLLLPYDAAAATASYISGVLQLTKLAQWP